MIIIRYVGNLQQETTTTALKIIVAQMQECVQLDGCDQLAAAAEPMFCEVPASV